LSRLLSGHSLWGKSDDEAAARAQAKDESGPDTAAIEPSAAGGARSEETVVEPHGQRQTDAGEVEAKDYPAQYCHIWIIRQIWSNVNL